MGKGNPPPLIDDPDLAPTPAPKADELTTTTSGNTQPSTTQFATTPTAQPSVTVNVDTNGNNNNGNSNVAQLQATAAISNANASVGLAQTAIDDKIVDNQIKKEDEHWVKAYWRPGMGWVYMLICFMDFVGFPLLAMFLPVIAKGFGVQMTYSPWVSLTLSNGGLFHAAMGGILGIAAWTRGNEKIASATLTPPSR